MICPQLDASTGDLDERVISSDQQCVVNLSDRHSNRNKVVLSPSTQLFDKVVELSRFTVQAGSYKRRGLPSTMHEDNVRQHVISQHGFPLLSHQKFNLTQGAGCTTTSGAPHPSIHSVAFTLQLWLYLAAGPAASEKKDSTAPSSTPTSSSSSSSSSSTVQNSSENKQEVGRETKGAEANESVAENKEEDSKTKNELPPPRNLIQKGNAWFNTGSKQHGYAVRLRGHDNRLVVCLSHPVFSNRRERFIDEDMVSRDEVHLNRWTHVAVVAALDSWSLYIDGALQATARVHKLVPCPGDPFILGKPPLQETPLGSHYKTTMKKVAVTGFEGQIAACTYLPFALTPDQLLANVSSVVKHPEFKGREAPWSSCLDKNEGVEVNLAAQVAELRALDARADWASETDTQLLQLFVEVAGKFRAALQAQRKEAKEITPSTASSTAPMELLKLFVFDPLVIQLVTELLPAYPLLSGPSRGLQALLTRFSALQSLNRLVLAAILLVDFSRASARFSLAHRVSSLRSVIFPSVKQLVWARVLQASGTSRGSSVNINRPKALKAKERKGGGDGDLLKTAFGQLYQQLNFVRPSQLRAPTDQRPFKVTYAGEGGVDAGGLFRDCLSDICAELQASHMPLFVPVPNHRGAVGSNQDKFMPHPGCTSSLQLSMYAFVGKLMGMACRGSFVLNLDLPAYIWKPLVSQAPNAQDVYDIDVFCDISTHLNTTSDSNVDEKLSKSSSSSSSARPSGSEDEPQPASIRHFVSLNSVGSEVELKQDGKSIPVTCENEAEYRSLLSAYRLGEVNEQVAAMRKGLSAVVPVQLLTLFTWQELQNMVCGKREIDINYLKANTKYRGVNEDDEHVGYCWQMLREFSHTQRQLFLRFVWGQSRLPADPKQFTQKFEIMAAANNNDQALPVSHTCFFSLELPKYSSLAIMKERFIYAIHNCRSIDTDHRAENLDWDA